MCSGWALPEIEPVLILDTGTKEGLAKYLSVNHAGGKVPCWPARLNRWPCWATWDGMPVIWTGGPLVGQALGNSACDMAAGRTCWIVPAAGKDPYVNRDCMKRAVALADAVAQ